MPTERNRLLSKCKKCISSLFLGKISPPLFLETSHFPFHPFITLTLRWWSRWLCLSYKTPSIAVLSLVNAGLFTQSSVDSPFRESSVRPFIRPATGLLVTRFLTCRICVFLVPLAIRLRLCECLQTFEACIVLLFKLCWRCTGIYYRTKTAASLWESSHNRYTNIPIYLQPWKRTASRHR
jgi:hypothetical protein